MCTYRYNVCFNSTHPLPVLLHTVKMSGHGSTTVSWLSVCKDFSLWWLKRADKVFFLSSLLPLKLRFTLCQRKKQNKTKKPPSSAPTSWHTCTKCCCLDFEHAHTLTHIRNMLHETLSVWATPLHSDRCKGISFLIVLCVSTIKLLLQLLFSGVSRVFLI